MKKPCVEFYRDKKREWRWRAVSVNGRIVAESGEGYKRKRDCVLGFNLALRVMSR